jgi:hypothetical protein
MNFSGNSKARFLLDNIRELWYILINNKIKGG